MSDVGARLLVLGMCRTGPRLLAAVARGGGLGLLQPRNTEELRYTTDTVRVPFGIRLTPDFPLSPETVHDSGAALVLLARGAARPPAGPRVLAEVSDVEEAVAAVAAGASGLVAVRGELSSFVLLQQLVERFGDEVPVWATEVGPRTAVAAVAGGAAGVLLDEELALLPEADIPADLRHRLSRSDTSLAPLFERGYADAEDAVRSIRATLSALPVTSPVEQGARLCTTFGSALPVAQGPMTRVSDQPGFAAEVAAHGGFPFVAVATADGARTTELLARTADQLGDKPWGAGILGFVPEALRAEQMAAVRAARPRCVLVAGGTAAQAKALEADGIAAFTHVPSPILLRQFLEAGVRRFVFEGAECGGHVGPRPSFVLWEQQLEVLRDAGGDVEVLFAGGVHDARSAAMVAAMAAEAAAAGAGIGVLMGTAYLFTDEAVTHGAITELFQERVIGAETTVTLETAPGHLTRCLPSPYTTEFDAVKDSLRQEGLPPQEAWQRLEELNTGRLRIASKGLRRADDDLVEVDERTQLAEGMYMAGQVAVLRAARTTIGTLHTEVTEGVETLLRARRTPAPAPATTEDTDVAIVGMACTFPGAPDLDAYWSTILRGRDAVTEIPADRWEMSVHAGQSASRWGGFLPPLEVDPLTYGIPPASMGSIDPAQLVSLETARRALVDAGYAPLSPGTPARRGFDRERTSVIFGAEAGGDLANANTLRSLLSGYLEEVPADLLAQLPEPTEDTFPGTLANVISGRIANRLDLGGANYTVDAACGSALAALDLAVKELRGGTSSLVLCGAVDLHNGIHDYVMFTSAGALSPTGRCRPFDTTADGIALGEGVACLVLKRLSDAERDGDRIYAVVKGVGAASDGRALGLTAPRPEGQRRALERAYRDAGVSPVEVGLVEAHGTGTVVGDATELRSLTDFFTAAGATPAGCALGSVKSQIGHTKCAAGLAGLIKAALSLWHGVVPPTLHLTRPNPEWRPDTSPFTFTTTARPWSGTGPRFAGVSAFGFGGTNFHAVLAGGPVPPDRGCGPRDWDTELVLVHESDVDSARKALRTLLDANRGRPLRRIAALAGAGTGPVRLAVVASSIADLEAATVDGGITDDGSDPGRTAFLFPGQGSQHPGMLDGLLVHFPEAADLLRLAPDVAAAMYPPTAFEPDQVRLQDEALRDTRMAQPALGLADSAAARLLIGLGVRPDLLAGHSYGELAALSVAGAFDTTTLLALSRSRADAIVTAAGSAPGAMAAVKAAPDTLTADLLGPDVVVANYNAPAQTVLSGPLAAVEAAVGRLREHGIAAKRIPVACAFHSPLVAPAAAAFAADLEAVEIRDPQWPVWSNRTARPYGPGEVRAELAGQLGAPVRFVEQIEDMYAAGARTFVETGPGRVLSRLTAEILGDRPHTVLACDQGLRGFLTTLAHLAVAGHDLDAGRLFRGRVGEAPPSPSVWTVDGRTARSPGGDVPANGLSPTRRIPRTAMTQSISNGRDQAVIEFLRSSRELIATQREVMLGYLGTEVSGAVAVTQVALPPAPIVAAEPAPVAETVTVETDVLASVVTVVSERTGYPAEMINGDLDLEADLSIDSIKRTEIAGTLIARLGLTGRAGDDGPDLLSRDRSVNALAERLRGWLAPSESFVGTPPGRYVSRRVPVPFGDLDRTGLRGRTVTVTSGVGQDDVAESVRGAFTEAGADVRTDGDAEITVSLTALADADEPVAPRVFTQLKAAEGTIVVAARADADHTAGLPGLVRAAARERTGATRLVSLSPSADLARILVDEVLATDGPVVVRHDGDGRGTTEPTAEDLGSLARAGAGPGSGALTALGLDQESVVLLLGGARGITAQVAVALAASGCRIELAGRTPWPPEDADDLPGDAPSMRAALATRGAPVADVERHVRLVLAQREIGRTLDQVRAAGGEAAYRVVDVRDAAAVRHLVKDLHARHGRVDGVVHAAGVIDDKLMADKDEESFRTVFGTKVDGARALLDALTGLGVRPGFVALFGSISAVLGNRGQTDYAAANDALETLGTRWAERTGGRALTVHWGPWAPAVDHGGMVSPELAREYDRRSVALIDPAEGVAAFLRELAYGSPAVRSVLYTASLW